MADIVLRDGLVLDARTFEIHTWKKHGLSYADKVHIMRADRISSQTSQYSVVLACHGYIVGAATVRGSAKEACMDAGKTLVETYRRWGRKQPMGGGVATINFPPTMYLAGILAGYGVDKLFTRKRFVEDTVGREREFIDFWNGEKMKGRNEWYRERRVYVQPR